MSIPYYNQGSTEEAILNIAKKRVNLAEKRHFSDLLEYPNTDPTNGNADQQAQAIIQQVLQLSALFNQLEGNIREVQQHTEFINVNGYTNSIGLLSQADTGLTLLKNNVGSLLPVFNYVSLTKVAELKGVFRQAGDAFARMSRDISLVIGRVGSTRIDLENIIQTYQRVASSFSTISQMLDRAFSTFVSARTITPLREPGEKQGGYMKTELLSGMRDFRPIYSLGVGGGYNTYN
tara:strand:- start:3568 stop:4269 length:702 start_codon:yes stop_codon:yes gene_type:complete